MDWQSLLRENNNCFHIGEAPVSTKWCLFDGHFELGLIFFKRLVGKSALLRRGEGTECSKCLENETFVSRCVYSNAQGKIERHVKKTESFWIGCIAEFIPGYNAKHTADDSHLLAKPLLINLLWIPFYSWPFPLLKRAGVGETRTTIRTKSCSVVSVEQNQTNQNQQN